MTGLLATLIRVYSNSGLLVFGAMLAAENLWIHEYFYFLHKEKRCYP